LKPKNVGIEHILVISIYGQPVITVGTPQGYIVVMNQEPKAFSAFNDADRVFGQPMQQNNNHHQQGKRPRNMMADPALRD